MTFHINIEIKAKSERIEEIRNYLKIHATEDRGTDRQRDTYFHSKHGRLKLREGNVENSLILYDRPDSKGPKQSDVNLVKLPPLSGMRELLRKSNQVKVVVEKSREIYFIENVKFHLDQVSSLGDFVEIEAIDIDGSYSRERLWEQCQAYIDLFKIKDEDFIDCSYSDMILELGSEFRTKIENEFGFFMKGLSDALKNSSLELESNLLDHVCYRVESEGEYRDYKKSLANIGDLLVESEVGGRLIATYKLHQPLTYGERKVDVVELPQPKPSSSYSKGFEHAEFVIGESFKTFEQRYPALEFDWSGSTKEFNPELRLKFSRNLSVKFHHQSLEGVIYEEMRLAQRKQ